MENFRISSSVNENRGGGIGLLDKFQVAPFHIDPDFRNSHFLLVVWAPLRVDHLEMGQRGRVETIVDGVDNVLRLLG